MILPPGQLSTAAGRLTEEAPRPEQLLLCECVPLRFVGDAVPGDAVVGDHALALAAGAVVAAGCVASAGEGVVSWFP